MGASRSGSFRPLPRRAVLIINGLALVLVGGVGIALILVWNQVAWAVVWLVVGLIADEIVLYRLLQHYCPDARHLESLTNTLLHVLDAQTEALGEQQRQIAALIAAAADQKARQQIVGVLGRQVKPNLATLVDGLERAEASLPDMLLQTRAWVAEVRHLATSAQAHVQALVDLSAEAGGEH